MRGRRIKSAGRSDNDMWRKRRKKREERKKDEGKGGAG